MDTANSGMGGRGHSSRPLPLLRLALYYAMLIGIALLIIWLIPGAEKALVAPITAPAGQDVVDLVTGGHPTNTVGPPLPWGGPLGRGALTLVVVLGSLALALPVAWVHMYTRRLRYDPSLVHAMIMLPIVVAGVVLVVKNSLALAFALAGIVAGVRFRQKLNEPKDAVYVLLALGIGLAAGVHALDVALVMSLIFNLVVLVLWRYDLSATQPGGRGPMLGIGNPKLLAGAGTSERERVVHRALACAEDFKVDGVLVVHAGDPDAARRSVEVSLGPVAKELVFTEPVKTPDGLSRFEVVIRWKKKASPVAVLGELDERWSAHIAAAEYIPVRSLNEEEDDDDDDDD